MRNKIVIFSLFFIFMTFIFVSIFRDSYANVSEDMIRLDLYNNSNMDILKDDMLYFIDLVDENIFKNSSFNMSNKLNENYDFLNNFVISFVLDNSECFDIINLNGEIELGTGNMVSSFISMDTFYDITYKIFGVEYYYIMDEDIVIDNNILLVRRNNIDEIDMEIEEISKIDIGNGYYDVYVKYMNNDIKYIYRFDIGSDNRLYISNLSIGE